MRALALRNLVVGFRLHGMNDIREFHGVLDEEDGDVVPDNVPVALISVKFHCETADITNSILSVIISGCTGKSDLQARHTALPREPCTVEKRMNTGVDRLLSVRTGAEVYLLARSS